MMEANRETFVWAKAAPPDFKEPALPTAAHFKDLRGSTFGKLTVVAYAGIENKNSRWVCSCECGGRTIVNQPSLRTGRTTSCGCVRQKSQNERNITHGLTRGCKTPPEFNSWVSMRNRCYNPKSNRYAIYGARGIVVCDRWRFGENGMTALECFIADMGPRPSSTHSIDRIDVNGNYEPSNCRWATPLEQARNKRKKS